MGVYVYKITRKARKIRDDATGKSIKIHTAEYAYKCGGSMFDTDSKGRSHDERCNARFVDPTARAWAKSEIMHGEGIKDALFVEEYEDGADVMRRSSVSFYDTGSFGEIVGRLYMNGENGKFRYVANRPRGYKVTFKGTQIYDNNPDTPKAFNSEVFVYVSAINEDRARTSAINKLDAMEKEANNYGARKYETRQGVKIEECDPPISKRAALKYAYKGINSLDLSVTQRVAIKNALRDIHNSLESTA
jgi:hypothetical protein